MAENDGHTMALSNTAEATNDTSVVVEITDDALPPTVAEKVVSYKCSLPLLTQVLRFAVVFLLSVLVLSASLLVANERMPDPEVVRPLPDILIELTPKVPLLEAFTDVSIALLNITTVFIALKLFVLDRHVRGLPVIEFFGKFHHVGKHIDTALFSVWDTGARPYEPNNAHLIAVLRFLVTYTLMMLYRSVVISMTAYPATDNKCQHPQVIEHPLRNMVLTLVTLGSGAIHCGDLMFSGHTIILCLAWIIAWEYSPFFHRWVFRAYTTILLLFSFFCIIASRSHYTDDIVVSAYGTVVTFLVIRHDQRGAPRQLQLWIRWWPCLGSSYRIPHEAEDAVVVENEPPTLVVPVEENAGERQVTTSSEVEAAETMTHAHDPQER